MKLFSSRAAGALAIGGALAILASTPVPATDFLRGDANHDGVVSIADGQAIANFLFRGIPERPECEELMDANDDGDVELVDVMFILVYATIGDTAPPAPFPAVGPDPSGASLPCESYGGGSPVEDPAATIEIRSVTSPGGPSRRAFVTIALSHSTNIMGYSGRIADPAGVIENGPEGTRYYGEALAELTGAVRGGWVAAYQDGDGITFTVAASIAGAGSLSPRTDEDVLRMPICIKAGTPAGEYPLALEMGELSDFDSGRAIHPRLVSGTLTVEADAGDDPCDINVKGQDSRFALEDAAGSPGTEVGVPLIVRTNRAARGIQFSVDFDETMLEATGVEIAWERPDGDAYVLELDTPHNGDTNPGNDPVVEGSIGGFYLAAHAGEEVFLPLNEDVHFLTLKFLVKPDAPLGTTEIRFLKGAPSEIPALTGCGAFCNAAETACEVCYFFDYYQNLLVSGNNMIDPSTEDSFFLINARLQIVGDVSFFRGDSNSDLTVNISDAIFTLGHLFLGEETPRCPDASDANDDGAVDISDPVALLNHLFSGSRPLPPPAFPACGLDPSPDRLPCFRGPGCE